MATPLLRRVAGEPVSTVVIMISCDKLMNKDLTSKSDPCCVLYMQTDNKWVEIGRTERITNNVNPQFSRSFELEYFFEQIQQMRFRVYDLDNDTSKVSDDDFLGQIECTLGEVVCGSPFTRQLVMKNSSKAGHGTITLRAQEVGKVRELLYMTFSARNLDSKDFAGKSDPFLEFSRVMPGGGVQSVLRTEVVKNNLNPSWRPIEIKANRLCGEDINAQLQVDCFDHDSDGSRDLIGSFTTTVAEIMRGISKQLHWPCINPKKVGKKKYQNSGVVCLESCTVTKEYSFLDYVFGGLQINFTVGIDFTASNGDVSTPASLHYLSQHQPNQYESAIQSVGWVIQDYDSDQLFPALGYGAKIPPLMEVSHCFALTLNAANPFCAGIQGVLNTYRMCLSQVILSGPTNFAPIILHVAQFAAATKQDKVAKNYFVLLIITDGNVSDKVNTKSAVVYASSLPMSIIIVGVGSADFNAMEMLDSDTGLLKDNNGCSAQRDIVQFVPFKKFEQAPPGALAKEVLAEIPAQICRYYQLNDIPPGAPKPPTPVLYPGQLPPPAAPT